MNRRGFALLAALWLIIAMTAVMAVALVAGRTGLTVSENRIALTRAGWAAEACHAVLDARYAAKTDVRSIDSLDLGEGLWCTAHLDEAGARLNLNRATPGQFRMLLGSDSLTDALLDWCDPDTVARPSGAERQWYLAHQQQLPRNGPLASPAELALIRGFDSVTVARLLPLVTTEGDGRVDLGSAEAAIIRTLPGLGAEAISLLERRRATGQPLQSLEALASALSPAGQEQLFYSWSDLQQATTFGPTLFDGTFDGGIHGHRVVEHRRALLVPTGNRLAVIRRIVE
jgi:hypothetical protein